MFVLANFIVAVAKVLDFGLNVFLWLIIIRAVLSWVNPDPYNPIVRFLNRATDPLLYWIRRRLPVVYGGLDLSPMIAILAIYFLQFFLVRSLLEAAQRIY
jgi:YggT family protein